MFRALVFTLLLLPGLARADDLKLVEPGKLTWSDTPTFMPFEIMKDGKPAGFDVDMVAELAKRMGLESNIMTMEFKGVMPALIGGRTDLAVSGLYMTAERMQVADMIPYMVIGNQFVVAKGNPKKITGKDTLCGTRIAVSQASAYEMTGNKIAADCTAAGKKGTEVLSVPGSNLAGLAVSQGRADVAFVSTATAVAMMAENPGVYEMGGPPFDVTTKLGIALRKDSPALKAALEKALDGMVKDGTYAALLKKWQLPPESSIF